MKLIDLSHPITPTMPVYPGDEQPVLKIMGSIDEDGYKDKVITICSHTGTHMDAPAHILKNSMSLDRLPIEHFFGNAFLINWVDGKSKIIEPENLTEHRDSLEQADYLLIHTGWSKYWGTDDYFSNYPVFSPEAADWLKGFSLKGIGLDTISADEINNSDLPIHKSLLGSNTVIVENLTNLDKISCETFTFSCFPLRLEDADGSPVRAVAILD